MTLPARRFRAVDVFTDRRYGGNPAALVLDADGLSNEDMLLISREVSGGECGFLLPPDDPRHDGRLRVFTGSLELPFSGHATIGAASILAFEIYELGRRVPTSFAFETHAGVIHVEVETDGDRPIGAHTVAPEAFDVGNPLEIADLAPVLGLDAEDFKTDVHQPTIVTVGFATGLVELASLDALGRAAPRPRIWEQHLPAREVGGVLLYVRQDATSVGGPAPPDFVSYRARMFAPSYGIEEDPASGASVAALVGYLADLAPEEVDKVSIVVDQGIEMGRPSRIEAVAARHEHRVASISLGGRCVPVLRGTLDSAESRDRLGA